ncbi:hypothetical protein [Stutzerimonas nitrititolerans]|uniref:hypothetical protein n=1 Tax=Stutzerimonas nitrititolerans TaxID=2482751 RepID=UPI00289D9F4B|nr:hypothetical protein [Stutzerimonas nitrititolerans]
MSLELVDQLLHYGSIALQVFGATSILGIIGFLTAYYAFPPNLSIEEVKDKTRHNFESRLVIKNIGKLPAFNIVTDISTMNFVIGGINMTNMNATDCGVPITKLASGEKTDIAAVPHVGMPVGSSLKSCDYNLKLKYEFRLPFYKTIMERNWHIELRNSGDEFTWQVSMR